MGELASAFPAFGEADWRKAAEAALKGGSLNSLTSRTSDGLALAPIYGGASGPRALRGAGGPWRALTRLDHPDAGAANEAALEDLANGADGLQVVFAGAAGAYGYGLSKWDSASLHRALDGVRFDYGAAFELDLGPDAEAQASAFAALVARSGARAGEADIAFGLDPLGLSLRSGRAERAWEAEAAALAKAVADLRGQGFRGPFVAADGRAACMRRAARPRRNSPSRSARRSAIGARSKRPAPRPRTRALLFPSGSPPTPTIRDARQVPRPARSSGRASGSRGARAPRGARPCRKRLAHDERARSLRERDARRVRGVLGGPRRRRQRRAAAFQPCDRPARCLCAPAGAQHATDPTARIRISASSPIPPPAPAPSRR